jgi:fumarate reductase subunit D
MAGNKKTKTKPTTTNDADDFPIGRKNYLYILAGVGILVIGFLLMTGGKSPDPNEFSTEIFSFRRITLAPIVVVGGFVFIIWAIMRKPKELH